MSFTLENASDVILCLHDGIIEEAIRTWNEFLHPFGRDVVEDREHGIDHQDRSDNVMYRNYSAERECPEDIRPVDDQTGEQQDDDGDGL